MLFFMCELQKIFFLRDIMDNQCANIFSNHAIVYGSHSVKFAFIERDNIFLQVNPHFFCLCLFIYPRLLNFPLNCFSQNLFCFYRGRKMFLKPMLIIGGVVSLSCFLDSLFPLILCCVCLLFTL